MRVVVSGAAGSLAAALLRRLCADPGVARVTGIDRRPCSFGHPKLESRVADVAEPSAHAALRGADAVVHLAFELFRGRRPLRWMERANVEGGKRFLAAARGAGVPRIVHLSSAAVYGPGTDLVEGSPLAPLPRFHYARQKVAVERWIGRELPHAAVLRPTVILGPHALPLLRRLIASPFYVRLPDPQPRLQCVHEDDVAEAIVAALERGASGPFNLAAPGSFSLRELVRWHHPDAPGVPLGLFRSGVRLAWLATGWGGETGWIDGLDATVTLDCRRVEETLGWRPRFTEWREIVAATLSSSR
ncbi:MAG TPA: NAD-dependent epimerase/dehydratase family protein [Casimicrobiaceae bacterium]|nr:NAD-dependent epimerase/dehydratase family protein [Casimicrobiaceae bacterium]